MKKQELLDLIVKLPANQRKQLADEVYQSLDAVEDDLNASWMVEANNLMRRYEDSPPPVPGDPDFIATGEEPEQPLVENNQEEITINIYDVVDKLYTHCSLYIALQDKSEGIPSEIVFRELKASSKKQEKQYNELFGNLEPLRGPFQDIVSVQALDDFKLKLTFEDGDQRIFDMTPYRKGMYSRLKDPDYFSWARVHWGGVHWPDGESLWAKLLYKKSDPIGNNNQ